MKPTCCTPPSEAPLGKAPAVIKGTRQVPDTAVSIPGGRSLCGTARPEIPDDGEDPLRKTTVKPFLMGGTTVTNAEFAAFVTATGFVTEAERLEWSFVFWAHVSERIAETEAVAALQWWRKVEGANWRDITGPGTQSEVWLPDHPAVHISWNDAQAYAAWVGGRLPTEAEWEQAARGGLGDVRFPWGDEEPDEDSHLPCNIWQGNFPQANTCADGYASTAPARSFAPNGYGLYNMVGNVWEWTSEPFKVKSLKKHVKQRLAGMRGYKLSKGGSFLCHASYCYRYRIAARSGNSPDSTTTHQGFRVVWDV